MLYIKLIAFAMALSSTNALSPDFPALQAIFSFFGSDYLGNGTARSKDFSQMTAEELGRSQGQCDYHFQDFVRHSERTECARDDKHIAHLLSLHRQNEIYDVNGARKPLMVKCLQAELAANTTSANDNALLMMSSVKEIVSLLKPIGNATKRHEPGSCVLVLFYTPTSLGCAHVAPFANMLPLLFPTLRVAAIDAFKFPSFNTEFGIVGLPTLLLFHQGRPIVKFYSDVGTFAAFVTRHTGIKHVDLAAGAVESPTLAATASISGGGRRPVASNIDGPLPLQPVEQPDLILLLAWAFILICVGNYFAKSRLCTQIVEMIKRNWRESEAQLEHN